MRFTFIRGVGVNPCNRVIIVTCVRAEKTNLSPQIIYWKARQQQVAWKEHQSAINSTQRGITPEIERHPPYLLLERESHHSPPQEINASHILRRSAERSLSSSPLSLCQIRSGRVFIRRCCQCPEEWGINWKWDHAQTDEQSALSLSLSLWVCCPLSLVITVRIAVLSALTGSHFINCN